ncbi:MAG: GDSL-type esterase/lipase family protein [Ruminococcus sp.]|nr:GDSL-type esterase/lipase family protein [Ruminococcus sp.]
MKKYIIVAAAALAAATLAVTTASAAVKYTAADLRGLGDHIVGKAGSAIDVDGDNVVDTFDLVAMRKMFDHTGVFAEQTVAVTEENVKYTGRNYYDADKETAWLVLSGSAVDFIVNGRSAEITINGDYGISNGAEQTPRYAVIVDGEIILDELLDVKQKTVKLFEGSEPRAAHVRVIHLSEATNGAVGVSDIKVDTDIPVPVVPEFSKDISIEFIGDSITCAYGVEGKDQYESFKTSTENFMKSYAYLTAQKLDADYSCVSYSGYGIVSGYTSSGVKNDGSLLPQFYDIIGRPTSYAKEWDHSAHSYDVIVVNLGTNDNTYVSKEPETRSAEFTKGYTEFLGKLHEAHPESYIICTLGTMGCTELYPSIEAAVEAYKKEYATDRIMCYQSETQDMNDGLGSDWHPNEITQQKSAYVLADKICQALGRTSDQQGIDVAAGAKYSTVTSDTAMMSDYLSDWDKSYYVTTVTGGSGKGSIQTLVSGIELKKNGRYSLRLALKTENITDIPFFVRNKETGKVYYEGRTENESTGFTLEDEFTSPEDAECEIVFMVGGSDSSRFTLSELKLVRLA